MEKLFAVLALLRQGNAVADPAAWKNASMATMALVPVLLSVDRVGKAFGFDLGIEGDVAADISAGIVALVGVFSHLITSKTVGLPPVDPPCETGGPVERRPFVEP